MHLSFTETLTLPQPIEAVWAWCTDVNNMPSFEGYGPVPGIQNAQWREGGGPHVGAVRDITNLDGSTHVEEVVACEAPHHLKDKITGGPPRWMVRSMEDTWTFEGTDDDHTRITRTMRIEITTFLVWPFAAFTRFFLRRAFRRHHIKIQGLLADSSGVNPGAA